VLAVGIGATNREFLKPNWAIFACTDFQLQEVEDPSKRHPAKKSHEPPENQHQLPNIHQPPTTNPQPLNAASLPTPGPAPEPSGRPNPIVHCAAFAPKGRTAAGFGWRDCLAPGMGPLMLWQPHVTNDKVGM